MAVAEHPTPTERQKVPPAVRQGRPRRRRPGSVLAPMLVAGLLLALAVYTVIRDREISYQVAVAAADIRPGTVISAGAFDLAEVKVPEGLIPGLVQGDGLAQLDGWVATNSIGAGELVSRQDLRPPSAPSALRAMSLPIEPERAVAGDLARGDRVDVIAVVDGQSAYVAVDLEVIAVASASGDGALTPTGRFSVTVAVDDRTGLALARVLETGAVSILRSTGATPALLTPDPSAGTAGEAGDSPSGEGLPPADEAEPPPDDQDAQGN